MYVCVCMLSVVCSVYACMYVCVRVCMYVCLCVCVCMCVFFFFLFSFCFLLVFLVFGFLCLGWVGQVFVVVEGWSCWYCGGFIGGRVFL